MKTLHEKKLKSGYTVQLVLYTENEGPLAVKLVNSNDDFIGQTFVSLDNINDEIKVYSNGEYELSAEDLKAAEAEVSKELGNKAKGESITFADKWSSKRDSANAKLSMFL